jgi:cytochrome c oxidase subunit 1
MRRRIADYDPNITGSGPWNILGVNFQGLEVQHLVMTISAFLIAASVVIFFYNFFTSQRRGEEATGNIWGSRSPEWQVPSPMPAHNFEREFEVVSDPYDYGLPDSPYIRFIEE